MALASISRSATGATKLPDYEVVHSYTQSRAHADTNFTATRHGAHSFSTGIYGFHDFEETRSVLPTKLGLDTHGPFSGTDATGCPDQVSTVFNKGNHTPKQWHQNNYNKYYQAFADRDNSEKTRFESKNLIHATDAQTKRTQKDVTKKLQQRSRDIGYWKDELNREIEEMVHEDQLLRAEKIRLERALDATATPLMIATDCLKNRERRQNVDHVHDNVEIELHKEVDLIQKIQALLQRTIDEIDKQTKLVRRAKHNLAKDWGDKMHAYKIDVSAGNLNNYTTQIMYRDGVDKISGGNTMPEDWAQLTHDNIMAAENERMASIQLRGLIEDVLTDVGNDQREQANTVDKAFAHRVEEMHDAKRKLEDHLKKTCVEITSQEKNIEDLKLAIREKEEPMKVAQSRLEYRTHRPNNELCDDPAQRRLLEEVEEIKASIAALNNKLDEANQSRSDLMGTRRELETEIAYKQDSLFIDREKCMTLRTRFPTITRLVGYQ
ncbi:tektin-4-like [Symsagittifera roscoffensis]|uniref:tektin-4-like n=1 Tax=Symsagittifera roscoffensis TaxID=84072 RepID=UPI00307C4120